MNWVLVLIGVLLIALGIEMWHFEPIQWLSNIPSKAKVIDKKKAARLGGSYLSWIGVCFISFGYVVENLPVQTVSIIVACFIPVNMVILVSYLVAQSKNIR